MLYKAMLLDIKLRVHDTGLFFLHRVAQMGMNEYLSNFSLMGHLEWKLMIF